MYRLNAVHIETATRPANRRESFGTRLAKAIKASKMTNKEFASFVQMTIDKNDMEDYVRFTTQDIYNAVNRGTQLKANKVAALVLATGLPRSYFEDFNQSVKQILAKTTLRNR